MKMLSEAVVVEYLSPRLQILVFIVMGQEVLLHCQCHRHNLHRLQVVHEAHSHLRYCAEICQSLHYMGMCGSWGCKASCTVRICVGAEATKLYIRLGWSILEPEIRFLEVESPFLEPRSDFSHIKPSRLAKWKESKDRPPSKSRVY